MKSFLLPTFLAIALAVTTQTQAQISFKGGEGPGKGKKVVLLAGDEEYRSEEVMPMLAKILSKTHGFDTTVVFAVNPQTGEIDPNEPKNLPGMEALDDADLCIMLLRFRAPKDEQMKHFVDYVNAGKPIIALRTSTHAFNYPALKVDGKEVPNPSPYAKFGWTGKEWKGGFGKQILGETWVSHWGVHKKEATQGVLEESAKADPILKGVTDVFGNTDVYEAHPPANAKILMRGQVLKGMTADSGAADYKKPRSTDKVEQGVNDPMMPIVWTLDYQNEAGKTNKILTSTIGSGSDLKNEDLRRMIVNGTYVLTGLEVPEKADAKIIGEFAGTFYGNNIFIKGKKPEDYAK